MHYKMIQISAYEPLTSFIKDELIKILSSKNRIEFHVDDVFENNPFIIVVESDGADEDMV